ncbi:MAG: response regulator [Elusimicrobia bacterium]|nr:response regulator [Elusimicrobiota bacterium]MBD3412481.1 response regulator [Elusimicrobiota bacterium]
MNKKERLAKGLLKLGELAKETGISLGTIRHYSNLGLIIPAAFTQGNFRLFERNATIERLGHIKKLSQQGMSLEDIQKELDKPTKPKEVLIVDDEKDVCEVINEVLKEKRVSTRIVYDGFSAGQALGEYIPDLVILDLHLPGVNGFDICSKIRQNTSFSNTKILAITGFDSSETAQRIFACGADAYLSKPFSITTLESKIDQLLV